MATKAALALACLIHVLFRLSIFIEQPERNLYIVPPLASVLYLGATLMVIYDCNIYPRRYTNVSVVFQTLVETIMILLLIEFSIVFIWCKLEKSFHQLLKCILFESTSNIYYDMGGDFLAGGLLILFSAYIFMNAAIATDVYYMAKSKLSRSYKKLVDKMQKMWEDASKPPQSKYCATDMMCDTCKPQSNRRSRRSSKSER